LNYLKSVTFSREVAGSGTLARMLCIYHSEENSLNNASIYLQSGVYIGKSTTLNIPVFLNPADHVNPHIMISGITGSGKSFLMKAIIPRMHALNSISIVIIDFTGEYKEISDIIEAEDTELNVSAAAILSGKTCYLNFSKIKNENDRVSAAESALSSCILKMRTCNPDSKLRTLIVLDEAWKLIRSKNLLEIIIREGRKYGTGIMLASQMLDDIDQNIFENIGAFFVFRLQNKASLDTLGKNYNLGDEQLISIQNLNLGSCMLIRIFKSRNKIPIFIRKVEAAKAERRAKIIIGADMEIKISRKEFYEKLKKLNINDNALNDVKAIIDQEKEIEFQWLISSIISSGADRRSILQMFRSLGFKDGDIADAFSSVVINESKKHQ
jgi:sRNA-binding carbon storage regulator CsrA